MSDGTKEYEDALAEAVVTWGISTEADDEELGLFNAGFEAGYVAGIDRGMEVEHEGQLEEQREREERYPYP